MKMKIMLLGLLLLPMVLGAFYMPLPIHGKVKGLAVPVDVHVTNLRTGISVSTRTNEFDEFLIEWANTPDYGGTVIKYQSGDIFEVRVPICEDSPNCVKTFTYAGGGIRADFDLTGVQYTECPECEKCLPFNEENCFDNCFEYFDCSECDIQCPTTTTVKCPECEECEEKTLMDMIWFILGFFGIGTVAGGVGYKFVVRRNKRTGKLESEITQHKHQVSPKGRPYYHGIHIEHDHEWFYHPKGYLNPTEKEGWGTPNNPFKKEEG